MNTREVLGTLSGTQSHSAGLCYSYEDYFYDHPSSREMLGHDKYREVGGELSSSLF